MGDLVIASGANAALIDIPTQGLMGNINNNPDDDLVLPKGNVLPPDINEEDLYYEFGLKCKSFYFKNSTIHVVHVSL